MSDKPDFEQMAREIIGDADGYVADFMRRIIAEALPKGYAAGYLAGQERMRHRFHLEGHAPESCILIEEPLT